MLRRKSRVFEITDEEIRVFCFEEPFFGKLSSLFRKHSPYSGTLEFERIPLPAGVMEQGNLRQEKVLLEVLARYREQKPAVREQIYLAIPLQQNFIRLYTLPWLARRDRDSAVSLLAAEEITVARADISYDYAVLSEEKPVSLQILLGAVRRGVTEQYVQVFEQAGFSVCQIDFAFSVLGLALGFGTEENVLYIQGNGVFLQLVMFCGVVPESTRYLSLKEEWEAETQRFLMLYRTGRPDFQFRRLVWSGDAETEKFVRELQKAYPGLEAEPLKIKGIPEVWEKELGDRQTELGDRQTELGDRQTKLGSRQAEAAVVFSYGARILNRVPGFDLLRQQKLAQRELGKYQRLATAGLVLFLCCVGSGFFIKQMALPLREEVHVLKTRENERAEQLYTQADLQAAWNELKRNPTKAGDVLAEIQVLQNSSGEGLRIEQASYKQGSVFLRGKADAESVQVLFASMRRLGWGQPVLTNYQVTAENEVLFSLQINVGAAFAGAEPEGSEPDDAGGSPDEAGGSPDEAGGSSDEAGESKVDDMDGGAIAEN